ncbi:MAG: hypothetical protein ACXQT3_01540 [Methermicoccaceae archaeon]
MSEKQTRKQYCPLFSITFGDLASCRRESCALYVKRAQVCALKAIATTHMHELRRIEALCEEKALDELHERR